MPTTQAGSTIVRNTSGQSNKYFDFVGLHGATMAAGEDVLVPGNIFELWARNPMKLAAINYALQNGLIEILKTPDLIVYDDTANVVKRITVDGGTVIDEDPDYGSYSGAAPNP